MRWNTGARARLRGAGVGGGFLVLSAVIEYEIERGLRRTPSPRLSAEFEALILEMTRVDYRRDAWGVAAELWAFSRRVGEPRGELDLLIAAHAIATRATLVTDNEKHFSIFRPFGLRLENWITR